jgi:hypothetical protein
MATELTVDGAGEYHLRRLRSRDDLFTRRFGYNVVHDVERVRGTYRPLRNIPVAFEKTESQPATIDKEGYVFAQGKFLGKYDPLTFDASLCSVGTWKAQADGKMLGVATLAGPNAGEFYGYIDANGAAKLVKRDDTSYGNSEDIEGFLGLMNGGAASIQEVYSTVDAFYKIIDPVTGTLITTVNAASINASLRTGADTAAANAFKLAGVAIEDTMRETRNNAYHYAKNTVAMSVAKEGYMTVPFVIMAPAKTYGGSWAAPSSTQKKGTISGLDATNYVLGDDPSAPSLTSAQRGATQDQTTLIVHAPDLLTSQRQLYIDHWGNPLLSPSANQVPATGTGYVDVGVQHLKLVDFKWANQLPMAEYLNSYPGLDVPGNQTQGIAWDIWRLANKLFSYKSGTAYTKSEIMDIIMGTGTLGLKSLGRCFGYAVIRFDIP